MTTELVFDFSRYEYVLDPEKYTLTTSVREEKLGATKSAIDCLMDTSQLHRKLKTENIKILYDFAVAYTADQERQFGRIASFFQNITGYGELSTLKALCSSISQSYDESIRNPLPEPTIEEQVPERIEVVKKSRGDFAELVKLHELLLRGLKDRRKDWYVTALTFLEEELFSFIVMHPAKELPRGLLPSLVKQAQNIDFIENLLFLTSKLAPQAHLNIQQAVRSEIGEFPREFRIALDTLYQENEPEKSVVEPPKNTKRDEASTLRREFDALIDCRPKMPPLEYKKALVSLQENAFDLFAKKSTDPEVVAIFADLIALDPACKLIVKVLCPSNTKSFAEFLMKDTHKIRSRLFQLASIKDKAGLALFQCLKLAYFIEIKASKLNRNYYKKQTFGLSSAIEQHDIPYSLMYNKETKEFYVLLKQKAFILSESCTYKKVTGAVRLPAIQKGQFSHAELVAQSVTRDDLSKKSHEATRKEQLRWEKIKGFLGIWKPYFHTQYTTEKNEQEITKHCTFSELADGSLDKSDAEFDLAELTKIAKLLLAGLCHMHEQKIIHADVKEANALFKRTGKGSMSAGWIDFGLSILEDSPDQKNVMDNGFYGAYEYTAPELFGVEKFRGDFKKLDAFAFGYLLYNLHFKQKPKWGEIINEFYKKREKKVPNYVKQVVFDLISESVEKPLQTLLQKQKRSPHEQFSILIYKLLRLDPLERISLPEASKIA